MSDVPEDPGIIYDELYSHFANFAECYLKLFNLTLEIDPFELGNVAQSYVYDLRRYVEFHEIDIPDRARRAAYICKWIMRLRPIRCAVDIESAEPEVGHLTLLVNESYALFVASATMKIDLEERLTNRMVNILLYTLRYRAPSEDAFILFFAELCDLE